LKYRAIRHFSLLEDIEEEHEEEKEEEEEEGMQR
jgi:hypothetical protein